MDVFKRKTQTYAPPKSSKDNVHGKDKVVARTYTTPTRGTETYRTSGSSFATKQEETPLRGGKMSTRSSASRDTYSAGILPGTCTTSGSSSSLAQAKMPKRRPEDQNKQLRKKLIIAEEEKEDIRKWDKKVRTSLEKQCEQLKHDLAGAKQAVQEKDDVIHTKMREYSMLEKQYIENKSQLDQEKQESHAKDDIIRRAEAVRTSLEKQCEQLKHDLAGAKQAVQEKDDVIHTGKPTYDQLKEHITYLESKLTETEKELNEKQMILTRFGIEASKRFKATGQATNINDDDPCEKAVESLDDLWDNHYRPACQVMESTAKQKMDIIKQEISSIKNAEDFLDIKMTNALQKAFNFSVDYIKRYLKRTLEEELQCQSAKSHRFISTLPKKQLFMEGNKLINLHYKETLDSSDKQKKSETIYKEFMIFVYDTIQLMDPAPLQEGAENIFLKTVNEGMRILSMEFTATEYPLFSQAAITTSEAIWKMIKLPSPILLKSHGMKVSQQMQLPFDAKEMRVHAASTKKTTRVAAFAAPIVISSKTGGVIIQGSVFCN